MINLFVTSNITHSDLYKNIAFKPFVQHLRPYLGEIDIVNFTTICDRNEYNNSNLV